MFAQPGNPRCPIYMYKQYRSHRPPDLLAPESRFYLRSLDKIQNECWYSHQPVGKNKIGHYMKEMAKLGGLEGRLVNHSTRKTFATSLRDAGVSPNEIAQLGGWKNVQSINDYSVPSIKTQESVSNTLATLSKSRKSPISVVSGEKENTEAISQTSATRTHSSLTSLFPAANISGGKITININPANNSTTTSTRASLKRKVSVIYSSDSSSQETDK